MKKDKNRDLLSHKQLFTLMIVLWIGRGLVSITKLTTKYAGRDGWISITLAGIIVFVSVNVILFLMHKFDGKSFFQISELALGKYLGKLPGLFLFVYYLLFAVLAIRVMIDLADAWLLPRTPIEVLTISLLTLLYYLVRNGIKVLGRFSQAIIWITFPITPLYIIPVFKDASLLNLMPIGANGLVNILKASLPGFYAFLGFEALLILYPLAREVSSHQEIVKSSNLALLVVFFVKVWIVFGTIAVFGQIEIQYFLYPTVEYIKLLVFPVIERVEFVFVYFWLFLAFASIAVLYKLSLTSIESVFKINGYKNTAIFLAIPTYFLTKIPKNVAEVFDYTEIFGSVSFLMIWGLIIVVFSVAWIRGRRKAA